MDYYQGYEDYSCGECEERGPNWRLALRYYLDPERGACSLQEVGLHLSGMPGLEELHGLGSELEREWKQSPATVAFSWEDRLVDADSGTAASWSNGDSRAWLYRKVPGGEIMLLWRRARLVTLLTDSEASLMPDPEGAFPWSELKACCEQAGEDDCNTLAQRVAGDASGVPGTDATTPALLHAAIQRAALRLSCAAPDASSLPAQIYWIQQLGDALAADPGREAPHGDYDSERATSLAEALNREHPELRLIGASFGNDSWKGERVTFDSTLRRRLDREHRDSPWGRQAFLEILRQGDDIRYDCKTGLEPAQEIVAASEAFLARYPATETSDRVRLMLAGAYETWWSLSRSPTGSSEFMEDTFLARPGAERARQAALGLYRDLSRRLGRTLWWDEKIYRLEHGIDTYERSSVCSIC